jgi:photosystem II stability/assembly factor-like uncharacterized protein
LTKIFQYRPAIYFLLIFLLISNIIYPQWISQNSGTGRHIFGLDVVDSNIVYCAVELGENKKTTNGGINWFSILPPVINEDYGDCSFINANTGVFVGPPGRLVRTEDGGATWSIIYHPLSGLRNVQFVNINWVYACGTSGIIRSTDSGLSWILLQLFNNGVGSLFFTDSLTGTIVGTRGFIMTTTNGGINWTQRYLMLPVQFGDSSLYAVTFVNSLTGYSCGNNGIVVKTTNGGVNWTYLPTGTIAQFSCVYFVNVDTGYLTASAGRLYKTTNSGLNWTMQATGTIDPLFGVEFIDYNTGWVCGFNGRILKTTNGGSTWIQPSLTEIPAEYKLEQNYPNPFNPVTMVNFSVPKTGLVTIKVYNPLGKEVETLVNERMTAGTYGVSFDGSDLASGVYFYKLTAGDFSSIKRMVIIK